MGIREQIGKRVLIGDGAMGTMMQQYGLQTGELPELLNFNAPDIIERIHSEYLEAGSNFISTNTFGANPAKMSVTGYTVEQVVLKAVRIARQAVEKSGVEAFVGLDIGPTGRLMEPYGNLTFEDAYNSYKEMTTAGEKAGADFILLETFTDLAEMRAAILAAKENTSLPVLCSVTFESNGRMLMGSDPLTMVNILQDLGIDALGVNCSLGPAQMIPIVEEILMYSTLPVLVQPNAGLPVMTEGKTAYDVGPEEFSESALEMVRSGASIIGGCCGTSPVYIKILAEKIQALEQAGGWMRPAVKAFTAASSLTKTVVLDSRIRIIGERINPTGKKLLKEALRNRDINYLEEEAIVQVKAGADILDINVGLPEIDEREMMILAVKSVSQVVNVPLQVDSADPEVLEAAVRSYPGKCIINSVNGKQESMDKVFPIAKKYGSCLIALTLDENGLPETTEDRVRIAERIVKQAQEYGIGKERIIVDCLTLTVSAQQNAAKDTLEAIRLVKEQLGVKTTLGASNVSFGLPQRKLINQTFLAMALLAGLDAPITDPTEPNYMDTIRAFEVLAAKDGESKDYIRFYGGDKLKTPDQTPKNMIPVTASIESAAPGELQDRLKDIILNGYEERAAEVTTALLTYYKPLEIVEAVIMPSLDLVGQEYESGNSFLPQLIKSAETVKKAFVVLKAAMQGMEESISYGKIILATVYGDIHDIGKNIVKVILENHGYDVIDLGKDVPVETIVSRAKEENIRMVGLSALMTTTVANMEKTIKALREAGLDCKTAVGGAVLTEEYAKKIGADYYCIDAMATVRFANQVFKQ